MIAMTNYRDFLKNHAEQKQRSNPNWNYSLWARALGLSSTSSLTKVLSGDRDPGPKMIDQLVRYFKFNAEEEAQFRSLILLTKDKNAFKMNALLNHSVKKENALQKRVLELFEFRLIAEWQHLSIRELFRVKGLKLSVAKIKALLKGSLSIDAVEKSLALLKGLGLIQKGKDQEFYSSDEQIQTQNEISDSAIRFYHEQKLDQAKDRLNDTSVEDREFQSLSLLIDSDQLPEIKSKIRQFIQSLESDLNAKKVDQLYQFQIQLFPVSERFIKKYEVYPSKGEHK
jgi:uncharacterized protein (TIGR02147 family)